MNELNTAIKQSGEYDNKKIQEIAALKQLLKAKPTNVEEQYATLIQLYDAYKYSNYDSAYNYAN